MALPIHRCAVEGRCIVATQNEETLWPPRYSWPETAASKRWVVSTSVARYWVEMQSTNHTLAIQSTLKGHRPSRREDRLHFPSRERKTRLPDSISFFYFTSPAWRVRMSKGQLGAPPHEGKNISAEPWEGKKVMQSTSNSIILAKITRGKMISSSCHFPDEGRGILVTRHLRTKD